MNASSGFFYLNEANTWPGFALHDLEITPTGSLSLTSTPSGTLTQRGVFRAGPFEALGGSTAWYRLQAYADSIALGTYIELFTLTSDTGDAPYDPTADAPFTHLDWKAVPRNRLDALILNPAAQQLWIGGILRGDGQRSPIVHQMRVDYGRNTYLQFLPAIYGNDDARRDLLERFLSLHASVLGGLEEEIADLPRLFDPDATPDGEFPSWLSWLAGWLAFDLNEAWSEADTRTYLAEAFDLYGRRGTVEGLRHYIKLYAGVEARIEEPARDTQLWSLGENSTLGFSTRVASAHAQGAVVGTTATLGQSHLTRGDDFGAALFEDLAHRFCVQVYCAELRRPGVLENVRTVIEREKPAHTDYHLCVIEPRMRVGAQACIGIDTIVAQGPPAVRIGMPLDTATLAARAEPCETEEES
ncbi:MAG: phage tail protein [Gammaproteobacteria bacterium]